MAWSGKIVGGLLGGMLGGPLGAGVGAALGHVVGDAARPLEIIRLDWQHHAFRASGPGVVLTPVWHATKLVGKDVKVRVHLGGNRREGVVVPEDPAELCALPAMFFPYADLDPNNSMVATLRVRGPAGSEDDARFNVHLPNVVRRLGGSGPARAVMALVATARAGNRALNREDIRFIRRTFCEGVDLDDDGLVWLHEWVSELDRAEIGRLSADKVADRLSTHLDAEGALRLVAWCWRGVRDAWPGPQQEAFVRDIAKALGTSPVEHAADADDRASALAILGLDSDASSGEIKSARSELIQRWHPDRAKSPQENAEHNRRMAEVNAAYRMLTHEDP